MIRTGRVRDDTAAAAALKLVDAAARMRGVVPVADDARLAAIEAKAHEANAKADAVIASIQAKAEGG